jgi:penicillin G amidase
MKDPRMSIVPSLQFRSRTHLLRPAAWVLVTLLLAAVCASLWLDSIARSALPQLDGTISVSGLRAPLTVIRDHHGIPTIEASNLDDLFFAQGYVTAQDRFFQMDATRRYAAGELAEVVGEGQLEHDRQQRILGMRQAAEKAIALLSPADRTRFDDYARGVNGFLESHRDRLPIEFRILGYPPKPWTIEDSMVIGAYMVQNLSTSPRHALTREKILAKLGAELTADLYVNSCWRDRPPTIIRQTLDHANPDQDEDEDEEEDPGASSVVTTLINHSPALRLFENQPAFFDDPPLVLGSNNWVISGAHTVSGKPLLSNDMHLGHQMPNLWYEAHLRCAACDNFDVAGVTLPGYPYVIVGHNQRIAWGFTNEMPTVMDVYIETFNSAGQYLTPDGWKNPDHRREIIHVKGKPDVVVDVATTRHGPIVTDLVPGETRKLAMRWTLYDGIRSPFFAVDSARDWSEFQQAFSRFDAPAQNVVYADVDGNIGYHATGKIPIRASGDGSLPENGGDNSHEWLSYIPFEKLPSVFNPASGIIATANARIAPKNYPYSISTEWEAPWRVERIYHVLESGRKFSAADMLALQTDIYSELDRLFADRFVYAVDHAGKPSARAKVAADILRQWDGRMTANSPAPTIAVRSREEFQRLLLEPKLGEAPKDSKQAEATLNWKSYQWMMATIWLENVLQHQPQRWLPEKYANYNELLTAAVESAVNGPDAPQDLNSWMWGKFNPVTIQNPVLGRIPILSHWTGPGVRPQSGSKFTVKAVTQTHGPSERMTVDLADLDQSTFNLVTGEAGNFLSPYYMDQWNAWYHDLTFPWPFSPPATQKSGQHRLLIAQEK